MGNKWSAQRYSVFERAMNDDLCSDCPMRELEQTLKDIAGKFKALLEPGETVSQVVEQIHKGPGRPKKNPQGN